MPQNCSVPYYTKKVYEETGVKISFHKFPDDEGVFRQWIVAIRRDIGVNFQVTQNSRVCSRHFKPSDYIRSLTGRKKTLKSSAVPSVFPWTKGSPAKRRAPKHRSPIKKKNPEENLRNGNDKRQQQFHVYVISCRFPGKSGVSRS